MARVYRLIATAAALAGWCGPAFAGSAVDAAGAASLQATLRATIAELLGEQASAVQLTLTPEGDQYKAVAQFDAYMGDDGKPAPYMVHFKPENGEAFTLLDAQFPAKVTRTTSLSLRPNEPPKTETETFSAGPRDLHGRIDPTFATESDLTLSSANDSIAKHFADGKTANIHFDKQEFHFDLTPTSAPRAGIVAHSAVSIPHIAVSDADRTFFTLNAGMFGVDVHASNMDASRLVPVLSALSSYGRLKSAKQAPPVVTGAPPAPAPAPALPLLSSRAIIPNTPEQRAQFRRVVTLARDIGDGLTLAEFADNLILDVPNTGTVSIGHLGLGVGMARAEQTGGASFEFGATGITVANVAPAMAIFVPHEADLRLTISGIDLAALTQVLLNASAEPPVWNANDARALFGPRGIRVAVEALKLDLGGAVIEGSGARLFNRPGQATTVTDARVTATGYDKLLARVQASPLLTPALKLLIAARGLAKPDPDAPKDGERLLWVVHAEDGKVTVNGLDINALTGTRPQLQPQPSMPPALPPPPLSRPPGP